MTVEVDASGGPALVVLHGRRLKVSAIQEVWRIEDEWWREPISRRYYLVLLDGGILRTIYQDLVDGAWYEQHG